MAVVVDKSSSVPYYRQLAGLLREKIQGNQPESGVYQLPSENDLATLHGLTRATVRHALDVLEREGWIYREKGKGSFAAVRRVEQELTQLVSTTEAMRQRGWTMVTRVLKLEEVDAPSHVAKELEIAPGTSVYELSRLRIVDDAPLSIQTAYLPRALCPRLEENDLSGSLYRLLEGRYGLRLWTAHETLRARCSTSHEAKLLQIRKGAPVMYAERTTYASTGEAAEYLEAVWRGDRYDFKVTLQRPPD